MAVPGASPAGLGRRICAGKGSDSQSLSFVEPDLDSRNDTADAHDLPVFLKPVSLLVLSMQSLLGFQQTFRQTVLELNITHEGK